MAPLAIHPQSSSISPGRPLGLCDRGRSKRKQARAARNGASPTSVPRPAPAPTLHACRRAASMSAMRDRAKADLRASNPRVRTTGTRTRSPDTKCAPANHGRERSARDLNSSLASTTASWSSARQGAALGRDRGGDARPHALAIAPLNAPRTQRWGRWVWCVPMHAGSPCSNTVPGVLMSVPLAAPSNGAGSRGPRGSEGVAAARRERACEGECGELTQHTAPLNTSDPARCTAWEELLGGGTTELCERLFAFLGSPP